MRIGNKEFDTENNTYIMGILNATPDSFSDGGRYNDIDASLRRAGELIAEGADILDVGGESTRPGYIQVSDEEEIARIVPVIERITKEYDIPVSVDTYKSKVAQSALAAGAHLINDIWGLKYDPLMGKVIAEYHAVCCLMHNRENMQYQNFIEDVIEDLQESVRIAETNGIKSDQIILDPGVGFAKTYENNLTVLHSLQRFKELGFPVLLGASRKSVIGLTLDLPQSEREEGTIVTTVMAVLAGCAFVRVHDVQKNKRAVKMTQAIRRGV